MPTYPHSRTTETPQIACQAHYGLIGSVAQALNHYTVRPRCKEIVSFNHTFPADLGDGSSPFDARNIDNAGDAEIRKHQACPHRRLFRLLEACGEWQPRFGSKVQSTHGMSEAGFFAVPDPNEPVQDANMGIFVPNVEAKFLDESSDVLSLNEEGVYICTPFVRKGYLDEPTHTAQAARPVTRSEIETAVSRHPGVRDVAVIPVVLPGSECPAPRAYIVKTYGSSLLIEELISCMATKYLPRMQLTGGAAFVDAIEQIWVHGWGHRIEVQIPSLLQIEASIIPIVVIGVFYVRSERRCWCGLSEI
ncbi:predicted protein [Aspergillus nidulans FGSC A4]|uniref:Uncharacterized protein n=1 Tax=Emericella nidulans (strain FGSC A4 / ATCC 38163 / CBS 112.46 / NRRL 194 / M139) TaxID=227321 RepID=Q5ARY6_EMENI|nr:hypothetical protein [Aspergillus nidulans FGSC A4]EAA64078.1 predicted protein [Aspergillus nidulans FGSC A4]CBF84604.1 TPA: conserved hypothetical protein [Aspergillus nidulans FGSC A4]|eukprot:XP_682213.1 predicted protein [Aspergillus nidulans FGSC A4]